MLSIISYVFITVWLCQIGWFVGLHATAEDDNANKPPDDDNVAENPVPSLMSAEFHVSNLTLVLNRRDNGPITAFLEDEDDCIYTGYMVGCTTSSVVVTGCQGSMQSIQVQSKVFGDMVFTTKDGVVKPVDIFGDVREKRSVDDDYEYYDDTMENPEFEEMFADLDSAEADDFPPPPKKLQININVYLDKDWFSEFGIRGAPAYAKRIVKQASQFWLHDSLDTKIDILTDTNRFYTSTKHLAPGRTAYHKELPNELIGPAKIGDQTAAHLYLTTTGGKRLLGLAKINAMCADTLPRLMVAFKESEIRTAMTVAHEMGHLLGIEHDFVPGKRDKKCGKGKKTGEYIMNYGDNRQKWSDCSKKDFEVYYNRVMLERNEFCLKNAVSGCACNGWKDVLGNGECKELGQSGTKPWCYVNQDAGCDTMEKYNGKWLSFTPCSIGGSQPSPPSTRRTTTRRTTRWTTRRTTTRRTTTRRPSSNYKTQSGSAPCDYKCMDNGSCTTTYTGKPRPGKKRGTCFPAGQTKGVCSQGQGKLTCRKKYLCSGIPKECKPCNEVLSC